MRLLDYPCHNFFVIVDRLDEFQAKDIAKFENEQAKNSLESFLYDFKDKLFSDAVEELSTEEERNKINEKFSEISDWVNEEGFDSTADVSNLHMIYK